MQIAKTWRQQASNLRLVGSRCTSCGALLFPERVRCSSCSTNGLESYQFSGGGTLVTMTTVHEAPRGFVDQVPYHVGLIRLDEGPEIVAMITDVTPLEASAGMRLEMVTRRIWTDGSKGPIVYGYKFRPADAHD